MKVGDEFIEKKFIDQISKKVLKNCNFFHEKNNKNNSSLVVGNGKLSITGGMKLKDFVKKYKLK